MKTLQQLAKEALEVQNACNGVAIALGMHEAMKALWALDPNMGTDALNRHPITILWIDKLSSLAGTQCFCSSCMDKHSQAFDRVTAMANGSEL